MKIKDIKIEDYLKIDPVKRKNGYGMYPSPFRQEVKPSFKIDYNKNVWYDFGLGKGGSIIDLVMMLRGCGCCEAMNELEQGDFSFHRDSSASTVAVINEQLPQITKVIDPLSASLISYCKGRGINQQVVEANLQEVHYTNNGKAYYSLGMKNSLDGWEIAGINRFKMVIGKKSYSLIKGKISNEVHLFEGMFDYLSALMLGKRTTPEIDCIVLHSVATLKQAKELLTKYDKIHSFLDNDNAGEDCLTQLKEIVGTDKVVEYQFYKNYNDLNDYLLYDKHK